MSEFLKKRLPVFLVAVFGIWLWRNSGAWFPSDRELVWRVTGEAANIRFIEVQVWDKDVLLAREWKTFPQGMMSDWAQQIALKDGEYDIRVFVEREGASQKAVSAQKIQVASAEPMVFSLP